LPPGVLQVEWQRRRVRGAEPGQDPLLVRIGLQIKAQLLQRNAKAAQIRPAARHAIGVGARGSGGPEDLVLGKWCRRSGLN
jgi:hypothetical protein